METQRNADDGISAEGTAIRKALAKERRTGKRKTVLLSFAAVETPKSQDPYGRFSSLMPTR